MYVINRKLPQVKGLLLICLLICSTGTQAFDVMINGFGTVCAQKSDLPKEYTVPLPSYPFPTQLGTVRPYVYNSFTRPSYVGAERRWNFLPNSKFGLQFTSIFDPQYKAVVQLLGRYDFLNGDNYTVKMDWAYLQYNPTNDLDIQFGKVRIPIFYYSDFLEVNHAQPWVAPPEEVYYIVGGSYRNLDGIKARYSYYIKDWTVGAQLYVGSLQENITVLNREIEIKARDIIGGVLQVENDYLTLRGSLQRALYDTNLNDPLQGLITATNFRSGSTSAAAVTLAQNLNDDNVDIIYVGLGFALNLFDDFNLLMERASILSTGIIGSAREGYYGALTYSFRENLAFTFTYGYTRPLQTEINKYNNIQAFFATPQYLNFIDNGGAGPPSGAGAAIVQQYRSYLGQQRSYSMDVRYDILPALALKGQVKYLVPCGQSSTVKYLFTRVATVKNVWVYRFSFDFVF